ncbi:hypothetical protein ACLRGF_04135 [Mycetocola zhadangensis]|uniref:hypothetical protein n=1 Tax=Mycetocola zhadangensis TaxID=1164595 RepID=UPI003A4E35EE
MTPPSVNLRRRLSLIALVLGVLVLAAVVVLLTRGAPPALDESTPEGVVQRYSSAVLEGDEERALQYLAEEARVDCGTITATETEEVRITLVSTDVTDASATVTVSIARQSGVGLLGASGYEYTESFSLTQAGDGWRIETAPWELAFCRNDGVAE